MNTENHSDWRHFLFYVGLALFACHELDAVGRHEWRLLPIFSSFDDHIGLVAFVLAHIPLFTFLFWATGHQSETIRGRSQLGVDGFLVTHAVIHFALSGHSLYEFEAPVETITVYGGAIVGLAHVLLEIGRNRVPK